MKIKLQLISSLGFFVAIAATSDAAIIRVTDAAGNSNFSIAQGTATTDVFVRIEQDGADAGNTNIQNLGLTFVAGDGGPDNLGGADVVPITAVSHTNTGAAPGPDPNDSIWDPQVGNLNISQPIPLPTESATIANVGVNLANTNVQFGPGVPGDVLAVFTLDTSALTAGQSDSLGTPGGFLLNPTFVGVPTFANWASGGGASESIELTFVPGTLSVAAVPEPGSFVVLSIGALAIIAGRRFRRRRQATESSSTDHSGR